jgi:hypothetical protein
MDIVHYLSLGPSVEHTALAAAHTLRLSWPRRGSPSSMSAARVSYIRPMHWQR